MFKNNIFLKNKQHLSIFSAEYVRYTESGTFDRISPRNGNLPTKKDCDCMKRVLRIGHHRYRTDEAFAEHIAFIKNNIDSFDEVALFTEESHYGYWDPEKTRQNAARLKERLPKYREAGVPSVGLNVLSTIGHLEEGYDVFPKTEMQHIVSIRGEESRACLCPTGQRFLDYVYERYATYAATGCDFIWIDDDLRPDNHGVVYDGEFCFCPNCITRFNQEEGEAWTFDTITAVWKTDADLRTRYEAFQYRVLERLYQTIEKAIHDTDPNIEIGMMQNARNIRKKLMLAGGATKARPGGEGVGYYNDSIPIEVLTKSFGIQRNTSQYTPNLVDIQHEFETFMFQNLEKSAKMSELETSAVLMSGCNGVLYNASPYYERQDLADMMKASKYKWRTLTDVLENTKNAGVFCLHHGAAMCIWELGIPVTATLDSACAAFLIGEDWNRLSDEQAKAVLAKNVYTDGRGVEILTERGFGEYCGATVAAVYDNGMAERFTDHPLNGHYNGYFRNVYVSYGGPLLSYEFAPGDNAEVVSNLETITYHPQNCSMYTFVNKDGGRFCADGYMIPQRMKTTAKRAQVTAVFEWLSGGKLPVVIDAERKIMPLVKVSADGNMTAMIVNAHFDPSGDFNAVLRTDKTVRRIAQDGTLQPIKQTNVDGGVAVAIDSLGTWDYILLTTAE